MNILITGVSSGLGNALKDEYLNLKHNVYGLSRRKVESCNHITCDLSNIDMIGTNLKMLLDGVKDIDVLFLNAGKLGDIKTFSNWSYGEIQEIMNVNVWSNKYILDFLFNIGIKVKQVVAISSGAAKHTYKGWGGYSISKASLKMLMDIYSKEIEDTHFISIAPGLVDTDMQDYLCNDVDVKEFPVINKFIESRKTGLTNKPDIVAKKIIDIIPSLKKHVNGSFIDLRNI